MEKFKLKINKMEYNAEYLINNCDAPCNQEEEQEIDRSDEFYEDERDEN